MTLVKIYGSQGWGKKVMSNSQFDEPCKGSLKGCRQFFQLWNYFWDFTAECLPDYIIVDVEIGVN